MIHNLPKVKTGTKQRVGRGTSSGRGGHTVGRGQKGQRSRSGYKLPRPGFEGGQMPLSRRLPKYRGFRRGYFKDKFGNTAITIDRLLDVVTSDYNLKNDNFESILKSIGAYRSDTIQSFKIVGTNDLKNLDDKIKSLKEKEKKSLATIYKTLSENQVQATKSVSELFSNL